MKQLLTICLTLCCLHLFAQQATLSGYIKDAETGELLLGATIYEQGTGNGTISNKYGFYSLTTSQENPTIVVNYIGYENLVQQISGSQTIDFRLKPEGNSIDAVEIVVEQGEQDIINTPQMSTIKVKLDDVKELPALLGEKDVLKTLQLLPGVQSGTEGFSGFYVRGGGPDQNLIILDEAPVYNSSHLFGFFSLFNGDAIKSVDLVKGGFPARYGGRLSSVVDMTAKEGNRDHVTGNAKIGLISASGVLEGPLTKKEDKGSFMISGRRTYAGTIAKLFSGNKEEKGDAFFYDLIAKGNYDLNENNRIFLSGYFGRDKGIYKYNGSDGDKEKASLGWGNSTGTLRWNHVFSPKVFANTSLITSSYDFTMNFEEKFDNEKYEFEYQSGIQDLGLKYDMDFFPNSKHLIKAGVNSTRHIFTPKVTVELDTEFEINSNAKEEYESFESGIYVEDEWFVTDKLKTNLGFRLSHYNVENTNYINPEPRVNVSYEISPSTAVKASYASMNQYIHLLSNTGAGLPTDLWVPSTEKVAPQKSSQYAFGFAKELDEPGLQVTLETYYKTMDNVVGLKEGSSVVDIEGLEEGGGTYESNWEKTITAGEGTSYGAELLVKKNQGDIHGWVGYTWSKTELEYDDLNNGKPFNPKYDRRNDVSIVGIYDLPNQNTLSATWVYGTGQAVTLPRADYYTTTAYNPYTQSWDSLREVVDYGEKNQSRMEAYHRLDLAYRIQREKKRGTKTWEFGVYNMYNRQNPFFYYADQDENGVNKLKNISLFQIIPNVAWSFDFN